MPSSQQRPLAAALAYAGRGWPVFPLHSILGGRCSCRRACPHPAKHPIARHGLHDATTDEGVATGALSGLVVIDIDPAKGGTESLTLLQFLMGSLPETLTARTGGGGVHLVYVHPGFELRNTAGRLPGVAEPLPGLDLRGDGGYVVAAPSRHRSGATYTWIDPDVPVALAPTWLRLPSRKLFPIKRSRPPLRPAGGSRYGLAALRAELAELRRAAVGDRNISTD
jgi:putative DNA primase/helicase